MVILSDLFRLTAEDRPDHKDAIQCAHFQDLLFSAARAQPNPLLRLWRRRSVAFLIVYIEA